MTLAEAACRPLCLYIIDLLFQSTLYYYGPALHPRSLRSIIALYPLDFFRVNTPSHLHSFNRHLPKAQTQGCPRAARSSHCRSGLKIFAPMPSLLPTFTCDSCRQQYRSMVCLIGIELRAVRAGLLSVACPPEAVLLLSW